MTLQQVLSPGTKLQIAITNKKQAPYGACFLMVVGVLGLEPRASRSRTVRDTKLRHTPTSLIKNDLILNHI